MYHHDARLSHYKVIYMFLLGINYFQCGRSGDGISSLTFRSEMLLDAQVTCKLKGYFQKHSKYLYTHFPLVKTPPFVWGGLSWNLRKPKSSLFCWAITNLDRIHPVRNREWKSSWDMRSEGHLFLRNAVVGEGDVFILCWEESVLCKHC